MFAGAYSECTPMKRKSDWMEYTTGALRRARLNAENALLSFPLPNIIHAYCGCCQSFRNMEISARHGTISAVGGVNIAFSETSVCPECRINSRMRFACEVLFGHFDTIADKTVYLTEKKTNLFRALENRGIRCHGSEWLGANKLVGVEYDGVEHQDIHNLTFQDESFDAVLCLDVLEHVDGPVKAISELYRVTRPGGIALVTFPFFAGYDQTVRRSRFLESGEIEHLLPAEYHGNPLGGGSLVFSEFGWDLVHELENVYGDSAIFLNYWSLYSAHFGAPRFALVLNK